MTIIDQQDRSATNKKAKIVGHVTGHQPQLFKGQRERMLELLLDKKGREVPAYALAAIGLQYCSRLKEIRDLGYTVENRTERVNGQVHGYYKLVAEPGDSTQPKLFEEGGSSNA